MNVKYILWVFKSTFKITAAYFVIFLIVCPWFEERYGMWEYAYPILAWALYFSIHVSDPKTERKYNLSVIKPELDRQNSHHKTNF